jgi:hypothetical protein
MEWKVFILFIYVLWNGRLVLGIGLGDLERFDRDSL